MPIVEKLPERLGKALGLVNMRFAPYYIVFSRKITFVEEERVPTMGVDKYMRLYYNPKFVESLASTHELAAVVLHEFEHLRRSHFRRSVDLLGTEEPNDYQERLLNIAQDLEINSSELFGGPLGWPRLPGLAVTASRFGMEEGHLFEWYYQRLLENHCTCGGHGKSSDEDGEQGDQQQAGADGKGDGQKRVSSSSSSSGSSGEKGGDEASSGAGGDGDGDGSGSQSTCPVHSQQGTCSGGSGAGGVRPWELGEPDPTDPMDGGLSEAEVQNALKDLAKEIQEHFKNKGSGAGDLLRWANELLSPQVDYKRLLRGFLMRDGKITRGLNEMTFQRLPRRSRRDIILPARVRRRARIAVIADTSGSMSNRDIKRFFSEIAGISLGTNIEAIDVFGCDYEADEKPFIVRNKRDVYRMKLRGGGGTYMGAGLKAVRDYAARHHINYACTIVATDMLTDWPKHRPEYPGGFIIIGITQEAHRHKPPQWADKYITVDPSGL